MCEVCTSTIRSSIEKFPVDFLETVFINVLYTFDFSITIIEPEKTLRLNKTFTIYCAEFCQDPLHVS